MRQWWFPGSRVVLWKSSASMSSRNKTNWNENLIKVVSNSHYPLNYGIVAPTDDAFEFMWRGLVQRGYWMDDICVGPLGLTINRNYTGLLRPALPLIYRFVNGDPWESLSGLVVWYEYAIITGGLGICVNRITTSEVAGLVLIKCKHDAAVNGVSLGQARVVIETATWKRGTCKNGFRFGDTRRGREFWSYLIEGQ